MMAIDGTHIHATVPVAKARPVLQKKTISDAECVGNARLWPELHPCFSGMGMISSRYHYTAWHPWTPTRFESPWR